MRALNEQWIVEIDGVRHMVKAVKQRPEISHIAEKIHPCHKCLFQMDDYDCAYPSGDWKCDMEKGLVIRDLGPVNEDGCLACPYCGKPLEIIDTSRGFGFRCYECGIGTVEDNWTKEAVIEIANRRA